MSKANKIFQADNNNPQIQEVKKAMKQAKNKRMY